MAIFTSSLPPLTSHPSSSNLTILSNNHTTKFASFLSDSPSQRIHFLDFSSRLLNLTARSYRITTRGGFSTEEDEDEDESGFDEAVALFNSRNYYKCHDVLEVLWNKSIDPTRTLVHGILQCAVGFHHLFNQNHKGAMMELGEGLCKLRKLNFESGPFHQFEKEISAVLEFIYQTQLEQAACTEEFCVAMDQSERSYQLLGGYAAGQHLYYLELDRNLNTYIVFSPERYRDKSEPPRIKIPVLRASEENLAELENQYTF